MEYLEPHENDERNARVVAGDLRQCHDLTDAGYGWYSMALSYAPGETDEVKMKADRESYLAALMPGLTPGLEYSYVVVLHDETDPEKHTKRRLAQHIFIPKIHLGSGKVITPYLDKIDRPRIETWQRITNHDQGYADPNDPARARALRNDASALPAKSKEAKVAITADVLAGIDAGLILTRDDLVARLEEMGLTVSKITKKSISVTHPSHAKPLRLEGEIYDLDGIARYLDAASTGADQPRRVLPSPDPADRERLREFVERKREAISARYGRGGPAGTPAPASLADVGAAGLDRLGLADGWAVRVADVVADRPGNDLGVWIAATAGGDTGGRIAQPGRSAEAGVADSEGRADSGQGVDGTKEQGSVGPTATTGRVIVENRASPTAELSHSGPDRSAVDQDRALVGRESGRLPVHSIVDAASIPAAQRPSKNLGQNPLTTHNDANSTPSALATPFPDGGSLAAIVDLILRRTRETARRIAAALGAARNAVAGGAGRAEASHTGAGSIASSASRVSALLGRRRTRANSNVKGKGMDPAVGIQAVQDHGALRADATQAEAGRGIYSTHRPENPRTDAVVERQQGDIRGSMGDGADRRGEEADPLPRRGGNLHAGRGGNGGSGGEVTQSPEPTPAAGAQPVAPAQRPSAVGGTASVPVVPQPPPSLSRRFRAAVMHAVGLQTAEETKAAADKLSSDLLRMIEADKERVAAEAAKKLKAEPAQSAAAAARAARLAARNEELAQQRRAVDAPIAAIQAIVPKAAQPKSAPLLKSTGPAAKPVPPQPPLKISPATISDTPVDSTIERLESIKEQEKARHRGRRI